MPSIWKAPSPIVHTAGRSGNANLAVTAYGIAASIVASRPDMSPCMPRRSRMWWPYQSAVVPASQVTVTPAGSRSFTARTTRRGLTPSLYATSAWRPISASHSRISSASFSCQPRSSFCSSSGSRASSVAPTSPHMLSSFGYRRPSCSGLMSTWMPRACPTFGRYSPYG